MLLLCSSFAGDNRGNIDTHVTLKPHQSIWNYILRQTETWLLFNIPKWQSTDSYIDEF